MLYPVNGESLWTKTDVVDLHPPPIKRQSGKPKNKMNKLAGEQVINESQLKRVKFGIKCIRCHKDDHNKATCKLPIPSTQPTPVATSTQQMLPATSTHPTPTATSTQQPPKKKRRLQKGLKHVLSQS